MEVTDEDESCNLAGLLSVGFRDAPRAPTTDSNRTTAMSPKKTILRELNQKHAQEGADTFSRPSSIPGFAQEPERYQRAVNELLQARLIEGRKDEEGHMTIALNAHRLGEVRKQLRPTWSHPALWSVLLLAVAVGAALMM